MALWIGAVTTAAASPFIAARDGLVDARDHGLGVRGIGRTRFARGVRGDGNDGRGIDAPAGAEDLRVADEPQGVRARAALQRVESHERDFRADAGGLAHGDEDGSV